MRLPVSPALALALAGSTLIVACGGAPPPAPSAPPPPATAAPIADAPPTPPAPPRDPFAIPDDLREEPAALMTPPSTNLTLMPYPPAPPGVPKPPATCGAFVKRRAAGKVPACAERGPALSALDAALRESDEAKRDGALVALESCAGLPSGLIRALRADLAPVTCADAIVEPLLEKPPKTLTSPIYNTLMGQALAGRMARLGAGMPVLAPPFDKQRVIAWLGGPMVEWLRTQGEAIQVTAEVGAKLSYYGRAVVAVEAGMADMRMVDAARAAPLPDEFAKDVELRTVYYGALDDALEPRKARGRDAALVGLADFAAVGALRDDRVTRARTLLSKLYGGRRIDALDPLIFPPGADASLTDTKLSLAARLPTFYAGVLLDAKDATDPAMLKVLLTRGVPAPFRKALREAAPLSGEPRDLVTRARLAFAAQYWRAFDVDEAVRLAAGPKEGTRSDAQTLFLAVALALRGGPANAADMMHRAPLEKIGIGDVAALDKTADGSGPFAALAAYDAAVIRETAAPAEADAAYWKSVEASYKKAAAKTDAPALRTKAEAGAKHAAELAAAIPVSAR